MGLEVCACVCGGGAGEGQSWLLVDGTCCMVGGTGACAHTRVPCAWCSSCVYPYQVLGVGLAASNGRPYQCAWLAEDDRQLESFV